MEIDLPDTGTAADIINVSHGVPLIVRPLFDQHLSTFTESAEVAVYKHVSVRAVLVGVTDASEGWPEAKVEGAPRPRRRRARLWL